MISIDMQRVLRTGTALSTEKDKHKLLDLILHESMEITSADAGTLYVYAEEENCLFFEIMRNHTLRSYQGGHGERVDLPPVPMSMDNVCSYCALLRKNVNIPDVYNCEEFDFSGPKNYDQITGYRTKSMMVIPFVNTKDEIIGVLQLINAQNENGEVVCFSSEAEAVISAMASQAAMAVTNSLYLQDITELFQSFVKVMISAIDELTPYNVNHTRRVAEYCEVFAKFLNQEYRRGNFEEHFSQNRREQLVMAAWMHDIGKVVTPLEVMNKDTRLGKSEAEVFARFDMALATLRIRVLEGKIGPEEYEQNCQEVQEARAFVQHLNGAGYLPEEDLAKLAGLRALHYLTLEGEEKPLLSPQDLQNLSIRTGTLTSEERQVMQNHVRMTSKLLENIKFSKDLRDVPKFAGMHHEFINGTGYPMHLKGGQVPLEARILSIVDIYEALTSSDRPYKKALNQEKALEILKEMAGDGKLDGQLVDLFAVCLHTAQLFPVA